MLLRLAKRPRFVGLIALVLVIALFTLARSVFFSSSSSAESVRNASDNANSMCSRLAAHPSEPGLDHKGVAMADIEVGKAFVACALAVSAQPSAADQFRLGRVMEARKAYVEAVGWYRKAAERGYAPAQYNLGVSYMEGKGVSEDPSLAAIWFKKAVDQDHPDGLVGLGVLEWNGNGVPRDRKLSLQHMRKAAALGDAKAKENLPGMEDAMAAMNELDAYANSLGPIGKFLGAVAKHHIENGYYDKDASGMSRYDSDAAEVERDRLADCKEIGRRERLDGRRWGVPSNCTESEKRGW